MRSLTNGQEVVIAEGATVLQVIDNVERQFPGFKSHVCRGDAVLPGLSIVVNGSVSGLGTLRRVDSDAEIHFLPALGGG